MSVKNFEELRDHVGHDVEIVIYKSDTVDHNVAIECNDCNEIIMSFENKHKDLDEFRYRRDDVNVSFISEINDQRLRSEFYVEDVAILKHKDYPDLSLLVVATGDLNIRNDKEDIVITNGELPYKSEDITLKLENDFDIERNLDNENSSYYYRYSNWWDFVVVSEKNNRNLSMDEGFSYLDMALNRAVDSIEEYFDHYLEYTEEERND